MTTIPPRRITLSIMANAGVHKAQKSLKWAAILPAEPGWSALAACNTLSPVQGMATQARLRPSSLTAARPSASPASIVRSDSSAIRWKSQPLALAACRPRLESDSQQASMSLRRFAARVRALDTSSVAVHPPTAKPPVSTLPSESPRCHYDSERFAQKPIQRELVGH